MKYCPNCGNELFGNPLYCPKCGFDLTKEEAQVKETIIVGTKENVHFEKKDVIEEKSVKQMAEEIRNDSPISSEVPNLRSLQRRRFSKKMPRYLALSLLILLGLAGSIYLYLTQMTPFGTYQQVGETTIKTKKKQKNEKSSADSDLLINLKGHFVTHINHKHGYTIMISGTAKKGKDGWYHSTKKSQDYIIESKDMTALAKYFDPTEEIREMDSFDDIGDMFSNYLEKYNIDLGKMTDKFTDSAKDAATDQILESVTGKKQENGDFKYSLPIEQKSQNSIKFKKENGKVTFIETDKSSDKTIIRTFE